MHDRADLLMLALGHQLAIAKPSDLAIGV